MSYDYFDSRGWIDSGPSAIGQVELRDYIESYSDDPAVQEYVKHGITTHPRKFLEALTRIPIPSSDPLAARLSELIAAARRARKIFYLSDGAS